MYRVSHSALSKGFTLLALVAMMAASGGAANGHWTDWFCDEDEELILWLHGDYSTENFDQFQEYGVYWDAVYHFDDGHYSVYFKAYGPGSEYVFSTYGALSTEDAKDKLLIEFDPGCPGGLPTAVGGWFFPTAMDGYYQPGPVVIETSTGIVYEFEPESESDFRGFISEEPIEWMTIDAPDDLSPLWAWPTVDHFIVGQAIAGIDQTDDFEAYETGTPLADQSRWEAWGDDPAAADFYATDAQAYSGERSIVIDGDDDAVLRHLGYTKGLWEYSAQVFVPEEMKSVQYFILLNDYPGEEDCDWSLQIKFNGNKEIVKDHNDGASLPLVKGQWAQLQVFIDLDNDRQAVYYNGEHLVTKGWTDGVAPGGALSIAAVDLWANGSAHEVYYDDISITSSSWPCTGDITGDGTVDVLDLLAVLAAWGATGDVPEDVTGDGVVDVLDLLEVLAAWGACA